MVDGHGQGAPYLAIREQRMWAPWSARGAQVELDEHVVVSRQGEQARASCGVQTSGILRAHVVEDVHLARPESVQGGLRRRQHAEHDARGGGRPGVVCPVGREHHRAATVPVCEPERPATDGCRDECGAVDPVMRNRVQQVRREDVDPVREVMERGRPATPAPPHPRPRGRGGGRIDDTRGGHRARGGGQRVPQDRVREPHVATRDRRPVVPPGARVKREADRRRVGVPRPRRRESGYIAGVVKRGTLRPGVGQAVVQQVDHLGADEVGHVRREQRPGLGGDTDPHAGIDLAPFLGTSR